MNLIVCYTPFKKKPFHISKDGMINPFCGARLGFEYDIATEDGDMMSSQKKDFKNDEILSSQRVCKKCKMAFNKFLSSNK